MVLRLYLGSMLTLNDSSLVHASHACLTCASPSVEVSPSFHNKLLWHGFSHSLHTASRAFNVTGTQQPDATSSACKLSRTFPVGAVVFASQRMAADSDKIISLNVGGVKFATSLETLTRVSICRLARVVKYRGCWFIQQPVNPPTVVALTVPRSHLQSCLHVAAKLVLSLLRASCSSAWLKCTSSHRCCRAFWQLLAARSERTASPLVLRQGRTQPSTSAAGS